MKSYDHGYQDAIRHIYTALEMSITQPLDEDHALGYLKILKRERDQVREAYETQQCQINNLAKALTGAMHRLETIRETNPEIALDRDIELCQMWLPSPDGPTCASMNDECD